MKHHQCNSSRVHWAAYDCATLTFYISFKPKGSVYAYDNVPEHVFDNLMTAKESTAAATETTRGPIGAETPGSEGSYLIHHVIGKDRNNPPYKFRKLDEEETAVLIERFPKVEAIA
jgi:hypothetical protein